MFWMIYAQVPYIFVVIVNGVYVFSIVVDLQVYSNN